MTKIEPSFEHPKTTLPPSSSSATRRSVRIQRKSSSEKRNNADRQKATEIVQALKSLIKEETDTVPAFMKEALKNIKSGDADPLSQEFIHNIDTHLGAYDLSLSKIYDAFGDDIDIFDVNKHGPVIKRVRGEIQCAKGLYLGKTLAFLKDVAAVACSQASRPVYDDAGNKIGVEISARDGLGSKKMVAQEVLDSTANLQDNEAFMSAFELQLAKAANEIMTPAANNDDYIMTDYEKKFHENCQNKIVWFKDMKKTYSQQAKAVLKTSPLFQHIDADFFKHFISLDHIVHTGTRNYDHAQEMVAKRVATIFAFCKNNVAMMKDLDKNNQLKDFIFSTGEFAATSKYGATGLLEHIRDIEEGTENVKAAEDEKQKEAKRAAEAAYLELCGDAPSPSKNNGKKKRKNKNKKDANNSSAHISIVENSEDITKPSTKNTDEPVRAAQTNIAVQATTTPKKPTSIETLLEQDQKQTQEVWVNVPYKETYRKLHSFLQRYNMQSSISIPDNIAPMTVEKFPKLHFFPAKKDSLPDEEIGHNITNHIGANHPETLSLIRQNIEGDSDLGKISSLMKDIIEKTLPDDIKESQSYTTEDGTKIPVKAITLTTRLDIGGKKRKVTAVFSKPRTETLDNYRNTSGHANAQILVARTLYIHDEDLGAPMVTAEHAYGELQRSPARKNLGQKKTPPLDISA